LVEMREGWLKTSEYRHMDSGVTDEGGQMPPLAGQMWAPF